MAECLLLSCYSEIVPIEVAGVAIESKLLFLMKIISPVGLGIFVHLRTGSLLELTLTWLDVKDTTKKSEKQVTMTCMERK